MTLASLPFCSLARLSEMLGIPRGPIQLRTRVKKMSAHQGTVPEPCPRTTRRDTVIYGLFFREGLIIKTCGWMGLVIWDMDFYTVWLFCGRVVDTGMRTIKSFFMPFVQGKILDFIFIYLH